ncbi:hypothetical protein GJV05_03070 [Pantoea agglomerans]|uniref:hypothetical protein n=1 Tax=Enterobacter agglomerans TaxID=549 RepID=UPI0012ADDE6E|nr:hypothetical protein [Pantoea agglomerans]MRT06988.1 hypothetical protein [Pantoea agglomerans]
MEALSVISAATKFLGHISGRKSDQASAAIAAVQKALHESEKYFICLSQGEQRSIEKEHLVSDLWVAAAEPVRRVDEEYAGWCSNKAYYWLTRDSYTENDIKQLNIGLEVMNKRLQKLMKES